MQKKKIKKTSVTHYKHTITYLKFIINIVKYDNDTYKE